MQTETYAYRVKVIIQVFGNKSTKYKKEWNMEVLSMHRFKYAALYFKFVTGAGLKKPYVYLIVEESYIHFIHATC